MTKLYRVQWTGACYVWAKSKKDAIEHAESAIEADGADLAGVASGICSLVTAAEDPHEWRHGLPYGEDPTGRERTVGDVIREMREVDDE